MPADRGMGVPPSGEEQGRRTNALPIIGMRQGWDRRRWAASLTDVSISALRLETLSTLKP
jgi:hypothetical protein